MIEVSILIPTIRPNFAARCIEAIKKNAGVDPETYEILMWMDTTRVGCPWMVKCMTAWARGSWVLFLGDDTIPQKDFLAEALCAAKDLPDGWGLVGFNDGYYVNGYPATHWMGHKNLLPALGGVFFATEYVHCYCDRELTDRANKIGRYVWAEKARIEHDHPLIKKRNLTGDYARVYERSVVIADLLTYYQRTKERREQCR